MMKGSSKTYLFLMVIIIGISSYGIMGFDNGKCGKKDNHKTHLSCQQVHILYEPSEDDLNKPVSLQRITIVAVIFAYVFSGCALFLNWYNGYTMLFTVYRRLKILDKKICICQEKMNKRAFSDALIGKLAHAANFDFAKNQNETDTLLKSMAHGPAVPP